MAKTLRSSAQIYLIESPTTQIIGSKLPSNRQVLLVFFNNLRTLKLNTRENASLAVRECSIFWEKARIPVRAVQHCITKLIGLYDEWRCLQKNAKKECETFRMNENEIFEKLNNLFDIAHSNALNMIKIEIDRQFLINQRLPGRPGCLGRFDKKSRT